MNVTGASVPRWLEPAEMRAWRAYKVSSALLDNRLHRELQEAHGLALDDYELLVRLSESAEGRMRMSTLAGQVASSKSRLSHQVARMEGAGLVVREHCDSDGRGVFAVITEQGRAVLEDAAPTHVRGVREHLVDQLSEHEQEIMAEVFERLGGKLRGGSVDST